MREQKVELTVGSWYMPSSSVWYMMSSAFSRKRLSSLNQKTFNEEIPDSSKLSGDLTE